MVEIFTVSLVVIFGAAVGSFLNVVIMRTHQGRAFVSGRSACPHCHRNLRWFEELPIISFLLQRGRCRSCHHQLSWQYLIVEVLTAGLFYLTFHYFHTAVSIAAAWFVTSSMILLAVYDARWSLLPDPFSFAFIGSAILMAIITALPWMDIVYGAVVGGGFFAAQYFFSHRRWVGSGDILLGLGLGLLLGWRMLGLGLFIAYFAGAIVAVILILTRKLQTSSSIAFGPYLLAGGFVSWLWGQPIIDWYFAHAIFR